MTLNIQDKLTFKKEEINTINFGLPDLLHNFFINRYMIILQKQSPQFFYENHKIQFVYGCFPFSIWSINQTNKYTNLTTIDNILEYYENNNISVKIMFNNEILSKKHLYDTFSNIILKKANNKNNSVFVSSELLAKYIKKKYPLLDIIRIVDLKNTNKKNILIDSYYNKNIKIKKIKEKETTYINLNPFCKSDCELYHYHKQYIGNEQIHFCNNKPIFPCELKTNITFYDFQENKNFITLKKIQELRNEGINKFLIADRGSFLNVNNNYNKYDIIESYLYYLIKPEFHMKVRNMLITEYKKRIISNQRKKKQ